MTTINNQTTQISTTNEDASKVEKSNPMPATKKGVSTRSMARISRSSCASPSRQTEVATPSDSHNPEELPALSETSKVVVAEAATVKDETLATTVDAAETETLASKSKEPSLKEAEPAQTQPGNEDSGAKNQPEPVVLDKGAEGQEANLQ